MIDLDDDLLVAALNQCIGGPIEFAIANAAKLPAQIVGRRRAEDRRMVEGRFLPYARQPRDGDQFQQRSIVGNEFR
jgi:hypothetical protein